MSRITQRIRFFLKILRFLFFTSLFVVSMAVPLALPGINWSVMFICGLVFICSLLLMLSSISSYVQSALSNKVRNK